MCASPEPGSEERVSVVEITSARRWDRTIAMPAHTVSVVGELFLSSARAMADASVALNAEDPGASLGSGGARAYCLLLEAKLGR